MPARPKNLIVTALIIGLAYVGGGSVLYANARLSKALIHTSSQSGGKVERHGIEVGEFRLDGVLYKHVLYPFVAIEIASWYAIAPVGSPYPEDHSL